VQVKMPNNIEMLPTQDLVPYSKNSRTHSNEQIDQIANSMREFGFTNPVLIDENGGIIAGHGRVMAAKHLGLAHCPCLRLPHLTDAQKRAYVIADNKLALNAGWDDEILRLELADLKTLEFDLGLTGFSDDELTELLALNDATPEGNTDEDAVPEAPAQPITVLGDVWVLGKHRLMCGDSTSVDAVSKLLGGGLADMVFTDPPYGMKKEKDGVLNDNLNFDDLLDFNMKWIPITFLFTKSNGSWYCWGIDEPLMDIYSQIIKPLIKTQQATFRNLITWAKGSGQGQNSELTRSYAIADEKCLFIMKGVQGFNNNADNYFNGWDVIREYLINEKDLLEWNIKKIIEITGKTSASHYFSKSQWAFPTEEHYNAIQTAAKGKAFKREYDDLKREYDDLKREYDDLKREYDDLKREYYETRAYFNNTHDNFNNVWQFARHLRDGSEGGHATPKPIELCERAIKSSSRVSEVVMDVFGGSGSTLIACEKTGRINRSMELDPKYCDVIIKRWQDFTGKQAVHEASGKTYNQLTQEQANGNAE